MPSGGRHALFLRAANAEGPPGVADRSPGVQHTLRCVSRASTLACVTSEYLPEPRMPCAARWWPIWLHKLSDTRHSACGTGVRQACSKMQSSAGAAETPAHQPEAAAAGAWVYPSGASSYPKPQAATRTSDDRQRLHHLCAAVAVPDGQVSQPSVTVFGNSLSFLVAAAKCVLHHPRHAVASHICSSTSLHMKHGHGSAEAQFYGAMKRKGWPADAKDMRSIVAIHNGVNERAWHQILRYEASAPGPMRPPGGCRPAHIRASLACSPGIRYTGS